MSVLLKPTKVLGRAIMPRPIIPSTWEIVPSETRGGTAPEAFRTYLAALRLPFRHQQGFYTPLYRIADFYLPEQQLIIEIDGPCHDPAKDRRKDERFLKELGIRTLRLTNEQVLAGRIPDVQYI